MIIKSIYIYIVTHIVIVTMWGFFHLKQCIYISFVITLDIAKKTMRNRTHICCKSSGVHERYQENEEVDCCAGMY